MRKSEQVHKLSKDELIKTILLMTYLQQHRVGEVKQPQEIAKFIITQTHSEKLWLAVMDEALIRFADTLIGEKGSDKKIRAEYNAEDNTTYVEYDDFCLDGGFEEDCLHGEASSRRLAEEYAHAVLSDEEWLSVVLDCFFELAHITEFGFKW